MKLFYRASYTVEAALIFPFLLFIMFATIQIAIDYHEKIKQVAKEEEQTEELPIIKMFYQVELINDFLDGKEQ